MRLLSRLPERRGNASVATTAAPRRRAEPLSAETVLRPVEDEPLQLAERPDGLAPARGIAIAIGASAVAWALLLLVLAQL